MPLLYDDVLTAREGQVLALLASGQNYIEIGAELGITFATVKNTSAHVYQKIGARDRAQASAWWWRRHIPIRATAPCRVAWWWRWRARA